LTGDDQRFRVMRVDALGDADWTRWGDLAAHSLEPNGWLDVPMLRAAAAWPEMAGDLLAAIVERDGAMDALLVLTQRRMRRLPLTLMTTEGRYMTWHADRHHPLVRADRPQALGALLEGLAASGLGHLVDITMLPTEGPLADALAGLESDGSIAVARLETVSSTWALAA